jgi:hypothetical protein
MAKLYSKLRHALDDADIDRPYIAKTLGVSNSYVGCRFVGRYPWTVEDAYKILDLLGEPAEKMTEYFPKGGKARAV